MILSVSRRCDIPRFAFDWFLERLDAGFVEIHNPFNFSQKKRVSLLPAGSSARDSSARGISAAEAVDIIVFWTRDPAPILENAENLDRRGYPFYIMTTLTSYPALLEPNLPSPETVIQTMLKLAQKIPPARLIWRYDPVFLSGLTDFEYHRRNFSALASRLSGTVRRVIVSAYDEYPRAEKRLVRLEQGGVLKRLPHYGSGPAGEKLLLPAVRELLAELAQIAAGEGMEIQSCAEEDLSGCGIKAGACIDGNYIEKEFGLKAPGKDRGQNRPRCLCAQSVDIGFYGKCPAGCVYCYASS